MIIRDIMTKDVVSCQPGASVRSVAALMAEHDCGCVPVVADGQVVGVVTDRDISIRAVAAGLDPNETDAGEVMSSSNLTAVRQSEPVAVCDRMMQEQKVRRLLIVDDENKLTGIVSIGDLARCKDQESGSDTGEVLAAVCA